ncbi:hypothetical protein [Opitutus sp. ER46]|uniref:hypothetical protein n=1 Tax=Opitutus sp. ER46 TaxID=2161864 RepID=UPI000D320E10|nr:hypothetical protein [Opitutus sp. ER46]PTX91221.1 hypothetical protein DB354_21555 [Opitutus sp. ER46]
MSPADLAGGTWHNPPPTGGKVVGWQTVPRSWHADREKERERARVEDHHRGRVAGLGEAEADDDFIPPCPI